MFQRIFIKCSWSGAYLTPRGPDPLSKITSLTVLFTNAEHAQLTQGPCPHLMPFVLVSIIDIAHSLRFLPSLNHHSWARMAASLEGSELSGWSRPASVVKLRNATCPLDFQALRGERHWIGFSGRGAFCLKTGNGSWGSREKTWLNENPDCPRHCRVRKWRSRIWGGSRYKWTSMEMSFGVCCIARPPGFSPSRASLSPALSWCFFLGRARLKTERP